MRRFLSALIVIPAWVLAQILERPRPSLGEIWEKLNDPEQGWYS